MRRIRTPPKAQPPKVPNYLFEPEVPSFHQELPENRDLYNLPRKKEEINYPTRYEPEPEVSSKFIPSQNDFDKDVEEQMRLIESNLRKMMMDDPQLLSPRLDPKPLQENFQSKPIYREQRDDTEPSHPSPNRRKGDILHMHDPTNSFREKAERQAAYSKQLQQQVI